MTMPDSQLCPLALSDQDFISMFIIVVSFKLALQEKNSEIIKLKT